MPKYAYKAYDAKGAPLTGTLECSDRDTAFDILRKRGHHPVALNDTAPDHAEPWWQRELFGQPGLSNDDLMVFTREIAALLRADLPIDEALGIIELRRGVPARVRNFTARLLTAVREGKSLSRALALEVASVPEYYWRLVAVGETGGNLAGIITDLAAYLERTAAVRQRISSALAYPMLLLAAAGVAVAVVTLVLVPAIAPLFADAGVPLPPALRVLSATQVLLSQHWIVTLVGAVIVSLMLGSARKSASYRAALDRSLLRLPIAGDLVKTRETARLTHIVGTLLRNGVTLVEALHAGARTLSNSAFRTSVETAATKISEGSSLSRELAATGMFTDLSLRLITVGERTGQLDVMLLKSADIHEDELQRRIDRAIQYLGPGLTLLIGGFAGALILTVLNAILSINDLALR